jgi:hypothetical protein
MLVRLWTAAVRSSWYPWQSAFWLFATDRLHAASDRLKEEVNAMFRVRVPFLLSVCAILLMAADPAWKTKPAPNWTEQDAVQVITDSPWSKMTVAGIARLQSEDERREGGNMGQPTGVGYDGINNGKKPMPNLSSLIGGPNADPKRTGQDNYYKLRLIWESALPVRLAELKAHDIEPPTSSTEGYMLAVYGVPGKYFTGDPKKLGKPLMEDALLKREGKKDVKPFSVEVFQRDSGPVVVYMFPLSAEISKKDESVTFAAKLGRIIVSQVFNLAEMEFQGKLEI